MSDESQGQAGSAVYRAWNGREYPWPPPPGWDRRSDGRYWPAGHGPQGGAATFAPLNRGVPAASAERLPPPRLQDRHGPPPLRRRSIVALVIGALGLVAATSFVRFDILGFTIEPVGFIADAEPPKIEDVDRAPLDEERELSADSIAELLEITECTNGGGARAEGVVINPLDGERAYLITVQFVVDDERLLDGFSEVVVPPGVRSSFSAFSASPPVDGPVTCRFGDVFRFIPD